MSINIPLDYGKVKQVAGLIVFRKINDNIDYLVLKPVKDNKYWSPPKGYSLFLFNRICCIKNFTSMANTSFIIIANELKYFPLKSVYFKMCKH